MKRYYVGLDVGTSSTKLIVFDEESLEVVYSIVQNYNFTFDNRFGITVNSIDIENAVKYCLTEASKALDNGAQKRREIYIVLDTMLHSLLFLDKDMKPLGNIIPWTNELGTDEVVNILKDESLAGEIHGRTGCPVAPTYPFYKLIWFSKQDPDFFRSIGKVASIKDYLVYILTGSHVVDKSIASGSGCYDIRSDKWADDLLMSFTGLDSSFFPVAVSVNTVLPSSDFIKSIFPQRLFDVKVIVGTSDGAASSMGTTFGDSSLVTISMGTSAAIRRVSNSLPDSKKMIGFGPWCYVFDDNNYIIGSATNNCGNVINWWKNNYLKSEDYSIYEKVLVKALFENKEWIRNVNQQVLFRPTVFGMRSVRWLPHQNAEFYNISPLSTLEDMTLAVLEGLSFKFRRAVDAVKNVTASLVGEPRDFVASGGLLEIPSFGTLLATVLNRSILYRKSRYDTVLGTVLFAFKAINEGQFWNFVNMNKETKLVSPSSSNTKFYEDLYQLWLRKMEEHESQVINNLLRFERY